MAEVKECKVEEKKSDKSIDIQPKDLTGVMIKQLPLVTPPPLSQEIKLDNGPLPEKEISKELGSNMIQMSSMQTEHGRSIIVPNLVSTYIGGYSKKIPSHIKYKLSPKGESVQFYLDESYKIKPWKDIDEFTLNLLALYRKLFEYDNIYYDVPRSYWPELRLKATDPSSGGFNYLSFWKELSQIPYSDNLYKTISAGNVNLEVNSEATDITEKWNEAFVHPFEKSLIEGFQQINLAARVDPQELFSWFKHFDNDAWHIVDMPRVLKEKPELYFFARSTVLRILDTLLSKYDGFSPLLNEITMSMIERYVKVPLINDTSDATMLAQVGSLSTTNYSVLNDIPKIVTGGRGGAMLKAVMAMCLNGQYYRIRIPVIRNMNVSMVLVLIFVKLLMPKWLLEDSTIRSINNYLAVHFLKYFVKPNQQLGLIHDGVDQVNIDSDMDLMSKFPEGAVPIEIADFLMDGEMNRGWANSGCVPGVVNITNADAKFMNDNRSWFRYIMGGPLLETVPSEQYLKYEKFLTYFAKDKTIWPHLDSSVSKKFCSLLGIFTGYWSTIAKAFNTIDQIQRYLTMSCLCHPRPVIDLIPIPDRRLNVVVMTAPDVLALFRKVDWNAITTYKIEPTFLNYGWQVHEYLEKLVFYIKYYDTKLEHKRYSKTMRLQYALDAVEDTVHLKAFMNVGNGASSKMEMMLNDIDHLYDCVPEILVRKHSLVEDIVKMYSPLFGFVNSVLHYPLLVRQNEIFNLKRVCVATDADVLRLQNATIGRYSYNSLLSVRNQGQFVPTISDKVRQGYGYIADIPTWLVECEELSKPSISDSVSELNNLYSTHNGWDFGKDVPECTGVIATWEYKDVNVPKYNQGFINVHNQSCYPFQLSSSTSNGSDFWTTYYTKFKLPSKWFYPLDLSEVLQFESTASSSLSFS